MFNFPIQLKYTLAPLLLLAIMLLLELTKPTSSNLFGFIPQHIADGEYWRIITGQLLHTNLNHLLLNVSGLLLIWALHGEYYLPKHYFIISAASLFLIGIMLALVYHDTVYAGLSGVLHALLIYGSLIDILKKVHSGWIIFIGIWLKVTYEITFGPSSSTAELISANVAVEAHLSGAAVGLLLGIVYIVLNRKKALN